MSGSEQGRDHQIYQEFDGKNAAELARKYGLSEQYVMQIFKEMRAIQQLNMGGRHLHIPKSAQQRMQARKEKIFQEMTQPVNAPCQPALNSVPTGTLVSVLLSRFGRSLARFLGGKQS